MKVTATQRCFHHAAIKEVGEEFEIADEPTRAVHKDDDDITKSVAVKGRVPRAFTSHHMKPGWDSEKPKAPLSTGGDAGIDLSEDTI